MKSQKGDKDQKDRAFLFPTEDGRFDAGSPVAVSVSSSLLLLALSVRLVFLVGERSQSRQTSKTKYLFLNK